MDLGLAFQMDSLGHKGVFVHKVALETEVEAHKEVDSKDSPALVQDMVQDKVQDMAQGMARKDSLVLVLGMVQVAGLPF
jgi:hypothetical protein